LMLGEGDEAQTLRSDFIESLREGLNQHLPDYMVPSAFVVLEHLPLTPNGKIDRKGLPAPDMSLQQNVYVAPTTDTEKLLCEIWSRLLKISSDEISTGVNFFQSGGHSLLMVNLAQTINAEIKLDNEISLNQLFSAQTIWEQAQLLNTPMIYNKGMEVIEILGEESLLLPSVYFIPGIAGLANTFTSFVEYANGHFNIKAFNHRGVMDGKQPFDSVKSNAESFTEQILMVQATGPYFIAGYSYGGIIALEIANLLKLKGHKVKLFMLDTFCGENLLEDYSVKEVGIIEKENAMETTQEESEDILKDLPKDVALVYQIQSYLFESYRPVRESTIKPVFFFANETNYNINKYIEILTEVFSQGVEHYYVQGNHTTVIKDKGAEKITSYIAHNYLE
jgi:thioesterase domain-containing protein